MSDARRSANSVVRLGARTCRLLAVAAVLAACGGDAQDAAPAAPAATATQVEAPAGPHTLAVCAGASLQRAFTAIARRYEADHPGAAVALHFDDGMKLLDALNAGEVCDVIAVADNSVMARITSAGHTAVGSPAELARNRIAIAVARGNPKQVKGLADFGRADLRSALGVRSSSIGRYARWVLSRAALSPTPAVEVTTADAVLAAVAAGDADLGIVFASSFLDASDAVERVDVPEPENTPALYSISSGRVPKAPSAAEAFRALALGEVGQGILRESGFLPIGAKLTPKLE